jgi:hypothetical protein
MIIASCRIGTGKLRRAESYHSGKSHELTEPKALDRVLPLWQLGIGTQ